MAHFPVRVPVEETERWTEIAVGARLNWRMFSQVGDPTTGSSFDQVSELFPFEKVSDRCRAYLGAAFEHLIAWADLIAPLKFHPEQVTNVTLRPAYTLARAAIESSAQAVWVMDTSDPMECIRRHLCLMRWDHREHFKSRSDPVEKAEIKEREDELVARVAGVFDEAQIRPPNGYLQVIQQACRHDEVALDAATAERLWRAASGAAHGKYWPNIDLQTVVPGDEYEPGHFRSLMVPDPSGISDVMSTAHTLAQYGALRFADYSGADIPGLIVESRQWLASVLPLRPDAPAGTRERLRDGDVGAP